MEQIPAFHSKSVVTAIGFTAGDQYLLNAREWMKKYEANHLLKMFPDRE